MKKRIATSSLKERILNRIFTRSKCEDEVRTLISNHGPIIPFRVLPVRELERQEIFLLLREKQYIPNHESKLFVEK